jgi:hypothetical protein
VATRVRQILVVILLIISAQALGADKTPVAVTVRPDGQSCLVRGRNILCTALSSILAHDLAVRFDAAVSVSSEGCGEAAAARASAVATKLREAGFTKVAVVGFLTEPNSKCAP